jgi:hypothetical protein
MCCGLGCSFQPDAGAQQGGDVAQLRDGGHALGGERAPALQLPVLVLRPAAPPPPDG